MENMNFCFGHPKGSVWGLITSRGLRSLCLEPRGERPRALEPVENAELDRRLRAALERYFEGEAVDFRDIPLDLNGATSFRVAVWKAARKIHWGKTCSYGELAEKLGKPAASRAVGQALGANPVPIVVPCHRVLAADGKLGGFSGGLDWKRTLLRIEGHEMG